MKSTYKDWQDRALRQAVTGERPERPSSARQRLLGDGGEPAPEVRSAKPQQERREVRLGREEPAPAPWPHPWLRGTLRCATCPGWVQVDNTGERTVRTCPPCGWRREWDGSEWVGDDGGESDG